MNLVLNVIFPIFAIILIGYVSRKSKLFDESAATELNRFVVWLALPAQLFDFTSKTTWSTEGQAGFTIAFLVGALLTFFITLLIEKRKSGDLTAASFAGLGASYSNAGYMGVPVCVLALGDAGVAPALIGTLIVVCGMFSVSVAFIEAGLQSHKSVAEIMLVILKALVKNPLIFAPILGVVWSLTGFEIYEPFVKVLHFLGAAASPCALISIGLFLAHKSEATYGSVSLIVFAKLVFQPAITWVIAGPILGLPAFWTYAAVLVSALPTGTGPYMLAQYYKANGAEISRVVLVTTLASCFSLSFIVWLIS